MKNNLITHAATILLVCLISWSLSAQTQTLAIGTLKNGVATLTEQANAERLLRANLPDGVTLSELKLEYSGADKAYFLTAHVSNNTITSVGIKLNTNGAVIEAYAGPGVELTCTGYNCSDCRISFAGLRPHCECFSPNPSSDMRCDMQSKIIIGF